MQSGRRIGPLVVVNREVVAERHLLRSQSRRVDLEEFVPGSGPQHASGFGETRLRGGRKVLHEGEGRGVVNLHDIPLAGRSGEENTPVLHGDVASQTAPLEEGVAQLQRIERYGIGALGGGQHAVLAVDQRKSVGLAGQRAFRKSSSPTSTSQGVSFDTK